MDIAYEEAPAGSQWRFAVYNVENKLVASAPYGHGHEFLLRFSRPVPRSTELSLGVQEHWAGGTWVPAGIPVWFNLARSPANVNLSHAAPAMRAPARGKSHQAG